MEFYPQLPISHLDRRGIIQNGLLPCVGCLGLGTAGEGWEVEPGREGEMDGSALFGQGNCGAGSVINV